LLVVLSGLVPLRPVSERQRNAAVTCYSPSTVPPEFANFFSVSAQSAAALVGLLFVAVSLAPEQTVMRSAPVERQAMAGNTFITLLNALFISLGALLPHASFSSIVLAVSGISILSTVALSRGLFQSRGGWLYLLRGSLLMGGALVLYSVELKEGLTLARRVPETHAVTVLSELLVLVYGLALVRAWQLLGAQSFGLHAWLTRSRAPAHRNKDSAGDDGSPLPPTGDT
jgi:hypothetical protein